MSPHYDRFAGPDASQNQFEDSAVGSEIDDAAAKAAAAMREADIEAAKEEFDASAVTPADLESKSIDELRELARQLEVPDRSTIVEQDELIAAIRRRL